MFEVIMGGRASESDIRSPLEEKECEVRARWAVLKGCPTDSNKKRLRNAVVEWCKHLAGADRPGVNPLDEWSCEDVADVVGLLYDGLYQEWELDRLIEKIYCLIEEQQIGYHA